LRPPYPNPPHKWADVIKAWADGAVIEHNMGGGDIWSVLTGLPHWYDKTKYRVAITPTLSAAEIERDEIVAEIEVLKQRVAALRVK
jgi:hypothetical protein